MKQALLLVFLLALISTPLQAQSFQDVVEAKTDEDMDEICQAVLGFTSPQEIDRAVNEIAQSVGLNTKNFKLRECSNIQNAIAKIIVNKSTGEKERYIIYDSKWLQSLINSTSNDWSGKFVLAHEIGHHLNAHSLDNKGSTHTFELEADYFAGRALGSLGASLEETLAATSILPENATSSHPARADRRAETERGWRSVENKISSVKVLKEDEVEIAQMLMGIIKDKLQEGDNTKDDYRLLLKNINLARTKYYKGYTEDMRYFEAVCYYGLEEDNKAMQAYVDYLGIENLDNEKRIKQIVQLYVESEKKSSSFFTNPKVLKQLSKEYYNAEQFDKSISLGEQFLSRSFDSEEKTEISKIIARSEFKKMETEMEGNKKTLTEKAEREIENFNFTDAFTKLEKAAAQNYPKAQYLLAELYLKGKGTTMNESKAAELFTKAAQQDNVEAQYMVGKLYQEGKGVRKNIDNAKFWYSKAYELGSAKAKAALDAIEEARLEELRKKNAPKPKPKTITEDPKVTMAKQVAEGDTFFARKLYDNSFQWFILAAKSGNAYAQDKVAWMYYKGKGVSKDKREAIEWWKKSAKQGNIDAINFLTRLGEW